MSKQDRQGVRRAADLEQKYRFGKAFSEVRVASTSAKEAAERAESAAEKAMSSVNDMDQEDIFNLLTNNGEVQGIYMKDGKLYINLEYADTGYLAADKISLRDLFSVYFSTGNEVRLGGYIGGALGSKDGVPTDGIAVMNASKTCYAIVTDAGVRLQAGEYDIHLTSTGDAQINSNTLTINGKAVSWKDNGDGTFTMTGK